MKSGKAPENSLLTLSIDVGGTGLKASVLDVQGQMVVEPVRIATPYPCPPKILVRAIQDLTAPLTSFDRVSIGFPGVVRDGRVVTAPHFGDRLWRNYPLAEILQKHYGKPVRLLNDAEIQGLGLIEGRGLELVLTLGTGAGTALFRDGQLMPHLELAQHPLHGKETYNDYVGDKALRKKGPKKWNRHVLRTIKALRSLLHYDVLYIGGGNSRAVTIDLPNNVRIGSNIAGITGGVRLWDQCVWDVVVNSPQMTKA